MTDIILMIIIMIITFVYLTFAATFQVKKEISELTKCDEKNIKKIIEKRNISFLVISVSIFIYIFQWVRL